MLQYLISNAKVCHATLSENALDRIFILKSLQILMSFQSYVDTVSKISGCIH